MPVLLFFFFFPFAHYYWLGRSGSKVICLSGAIRKSQNSHYPMQILPSLVSFSIYLRFKLGQDVEQEFSCSCCQCGASWVLAWEEATSPALAALKPALSQMWKLRSFAPDSTSPFLPQLSCQAAVPRGNPKFPSVLHIPVFLFWKFLFEYYTQNVLN